MATLCVDEEGQYLGNTKRIKQSMYACMLRLWRQMMEEGKITQVIIEAPRVIPADGGGRQNNTGDKRRPLSNPSWWEAK